MLVHIDLEIIIALVHLYMQHPILIIIGIRVIIIIFGGILPIQMKLENDHAILDFIYHQQMNELLYLIYELVYEFFHHLEVSLLM